MPREKTSVSARRTPEGPSGRWSRKSRSPSARAWRKSWAVTPAAVTAAFLKRLTPDGRPAASRAERPHRPHGKGQRHGATILPCATSLHEKLLTEVSSGLELGRRGACEAERLEHRHFPGKSTKLLLARLAPMDSVPTATLARRLAKLRRQTGRHSPLGNVRRPKRGILCVLRKKTAEFLKISLRPCTPPGACAHAFHAAAIRRNYDSSASAIKLYTLPSPPPPDSGSGPAAIDGRAISQRFGR